MKPEHLGIVVASVLSLLAACEKQPEPPALEPVPPSQSATPTPAQPPPRPTAPPKLPEVAVTWNDPEGWERLNQQSPMRKATYRVPKTGGDSEGGELAVFYFGPGEGGDIEANITRWIGQYQGVTAEDAKRSTRSANGMNQHIVEIEKGTYNSGMPGGPTKPKEDYGLLGGIVEAPSGSYFFKLTGPSATVKAARDKFLKLLDSVKPQS